MEKLEFGETAVLENGKEYVCFASLEENGVSYVINGELQLEIIQDTNLKQHLYELFKTRMGNQRGL